MKISDDVHLVGSGALGCSLTHDSDCNVYALRCGEEYALIDAGSGAEPERILEQLAADEIPARNITSLLLTHYHLDHCGGASFLRSHLRLKITASVETAEALETGNEETIGLAAARKAGIYSETAHLKRCVVDRKLQGGETWRVSDATIEALRTPGHSRDMISYLVRKPGRLLLFCGDTIFYGGRIVLQDVADCDVPAYTRTLRLLASLPVDELYPGHMIWTLRDAHRHFDAAMEYVNRMRLPPNLV